MTRYKICPRCNEKNPENTQRCKGCDLDIRGVSITDEQQLHAKEMKTVTIFVVAVGCLIGLIAAVSSGAKFSDVVRWLAIIGLAGGMTWYIVWGIKGGLKKHTLAFIIPIVIILGVVGYYGRGLWLLSQAENAYYRNSDCETTLTIATTIQQQYPPSIAPYANKSKTWREICQAVTQKKHGQIRQAEEILTSLWNTQEIERQQALAVGFTEEDLMHSLSLSTGESAQKLMNEALSTACAGQAVESPAIAISENHHALAQAAITLPQNYEATVPGELYYAVCIGENVTEVDKCEYLTTDFDRRYIVLQQVALEVAIRDIVTGEVIDSKILWGDKPICPSETAFNARTKTHKFQTGSRPSASDVMSWTVSILEENMSHK